MSTTKRILIILPDGVSLRNYVYTDFAQLAKSENIELIYWNNTPLDLTQLGFQEIKFPSIRLHWRTDALKNAITHNELNWFQNTTGNSIYQAYKFPWNTRGIKNKIKTALAQLYIKKKPTPGYIVRLREKLRKQETRTPFYTSCLQTIKEVQPDLIFCASQRPIAAVAPMQAAKQLGIPNICAIFSWDNLPKATLVVEADQYVVWSEHMKEELNKYYPFSKKATVHITGTPQFENHYNKDVLLSRDAFYTAHGLDEDTTYICFSGDDETTSPYDPQYLCDVAQAVKHFNKENKQQVGIIFRRCPVDFSDRYDWVLSQYNHIVPVEPLWESVGEQWDKKIPTPEDLALQANIAHHTALVINVGSSMVFDYAAHNKPCAYLNYNPEGSDVKIKDINTIYKFIHFESMPSREAVIWLDSKSSILEHITRVIEKRSNQIEYSHAWFQKIVQHPVNQSSERVVQVLSSLINE